MRKPKHVWMSNFRFVCGHCGTACPIPMPVSIGMFCVICRQFTKEHKNCKPAAPAPDGKVIREESRQ